MLLFNFLQRKLHNDRENKNYMKNIIRYFITILPFCYMGFIWYISGKPSDAVINTGLSFDTLLKELLHLIEFAILYYLLVLLLSIHGKMTPKNNRLIALLSIIYGLVDECHQYFVPFRSATFIDFAKDTIGVLFLWYFVTRIYFGRNTFRNRLD